MTRFFSVCTNCFSLWVILGTIYAWYFPEHFAWSGGMIPFLLGVIMLGMGLTLSFKDFEHAFRRKAAVAVGVGAQFIIMPTAGYTIAKVFGLPADLAVGLILVSCCPGGTASNVICYLARANLPLSLLMTMTSTFLAILVTPFLTKFLAGSYMEVNALALLLSTLKIVLVPLLAGLLLNQYVPRAVRVARTFSPLVSVIVIVIIVGFIVSDRKELIKEAAIPLFTAVFLLHLTGFLLGYHFPRIFKYDESIRRTVSIEVGMQNSGLGAALAATHFAAQPLTAVPSAISAVYHCLIGSVLAVVWRRRPPAQVIPTDDVPGDQEEQHSH